MGKIKKTIVSLGMAAALAVTGGTIADVATSHNTSQAHAETWTQGPIKYQWDWYRGSDGRYYCGVWAYNDYNWWEETFQGKRDGWEREWYALC